MSAASPKVELARRVQQTLLPSGQPVCSRIEVACECVPAWEVGGDFYDTFSVDQQRVCEKGWAALHWRACA
jgi:serine phosphatase RsbU (regulator of sigma subunit)